MKTGSSECECRDCFNAASGGQCNECAAAGCSGTGECESEGAYGELEGEDPTAVARFAQFERLPQN